MSEYEERFLEPKKKPLFEDDGEDFSVYLSKWWKRNGKYIYMIIGLVIITIIGMSVFLNDLFVFTPSTNPNPDPFPWWWWLLLEP